MLHFSRWKTILIWLTVLAGILYAAPNLVPASTLASLPNWLPKRQLTLGLDLQGGSHILLQIDRQDLANERLESARDEVRTSLRDAQIGYTGLTGTANSIQVRIRDQGQIEAAKTALERLTQPISTGLFMSGSVTEMEMAEPEPGLLRFTLTEAGIDYRIAAALTQSIEVVGRRVNELGTTEPIIQRQGSERIMVQVPGLQDPQRLKDILGQTAKLTFQMVDQSVPVEEAISGRPPAGSTVMYSTDEPRVPHLIENRIIVSGENLVDAQATFDQRTNEPVVSFRFDSRGATRFGQATQANVGRLFAIILDDEVISAPQIREPILGGTGQISGSFTVESANDLAVLLRAGALPADLTIVEERTVGPSLGSDSIEAGQFASIIALFLVVGFMLFAYGRLGLIANIALLANVALIIAVLSVLGATLTLPGIAGIVLTMGMAVDSNVIIFERVREENRQGRSIVQSMDSGFRQALATVVDANVTTLIAAVILFFLGSGPIKGFAVTLAIGIVTTVFTAFTLTRWLVAFWLRRQRPKTMPSGVMRLVPDDTRVPFMAFRKYAFTLSLLFSITSAVLFFTVGMNYGIDFRGGSSIEVQAKGQQADIGDIRERLTGLELGEVQVQEFGSARDVLIRIGTQGGGDIAEQSAVQKVRSALETDYDFRRIEVVGPTVSSELAFNGTMGVLASLLAMLVYIWIRFEWQFGLGAIISTFHDVILMIGFYVVAGIEFNLTSIAAILTIVGYSINDTVVVYDRIRENLRRYKRMPIAELLDLSMNQTLARTVLTGVTTLFALAALSIWGGEVIQSFTVAMIFGILAGTYSSIFVAGPLLILFKLRPGALSPEEVAAAKEPPAQQAL
ncbi:MULTISPECIES: protein translocase subunit SecDF [unclassified Mesorhizobium]|uniref:protein translocase subunit SecDF n=1 Tax=unclassified Mesorhizobium TaxID=325217 RepID=UPI000FE7634E|nr:MULTISPECIES: protein translocase subunit SecDF [unclassified Mesorhizobium]RWB29392.1 MAG: protein translocase subunit SecDF [Mesorhizobium sp.]RWB32881.1 MAG: protein translocase subunit SecDF [Mesorhizobium sp.]RWC18297.1 MAG: protein translocase subunit SecDF [Mesorhizobium sp.]RWD19213.1 MAG: protein translocase subunit SecDF [Mesorhizobium sp.]RWE67520.1 MAG: protein translocase subunit SecDF [Mesorhizobium sp.]